MSLSYGWEKLHTAVHSLCGTSSQNQRLVNANDLPDEMREEFQQFMGEMTSVDAVGDEGSVQATVDILGETGVSRAIEKIIGFYDAVCRRCEPFKI